MKKEIVRLTVIIVCLFIGNRVFNHVSAWCGISIIVLVFGYIVYQINKSIKNKKNEGN